MTANPGSFRKRWRLLGIALIVTILGHDLFMATTVQAATHDREPAHHVAEPSSNSSHDDPDPVHPGDCAVTRLAVTRSVDQLAVSLQAAPGACLVSFDLLPSRAFALVWEAPVLPAVVRRVLFQVFRL